MAIITFSWVQTGKVFKVFGIQSILCIIKLFWRSTSSVNACVKEDSEKLNQFPIKPLHHFPFCTHSALFCIENFSHILPMYSCNQRLSAKTISERLLVISFQNIRLQGDPTKFEFYKFIGHDFHLSYDASSILLSKPILYTMCIRRRLKHIHLWW